MTVAPRHTSSWSPSRRRLLKAGVLGAAALAAPMPSGTPTARARRLVHDEITPLYDYAGLDWRRAAGQEIRLGAFENPWLHAIRPFLGRFTELTGIGVKLEIEPLSSYMKPPRRLYGWFHESRLPDVLMVSSNSRDEAHKHFEILEPYYDNPDLFNPHWWDEDDFFPGARRIEENAGGERNALALASETQILFCHGAALKAADSDVPQDMDALMRLAERLHRQGGRIVMRARPTALASAWTAAGFIFSYGGSIIDARGGSGLRTPETEAGVETYGRLLSRFGPPDIADYDADTVLRAFNLGEAAIGCDSSSLVPDLRRPPEGVADPEIGYGAFPAAAGRKRGVPAFWHWMIGLNDRSERKIAAWLFLLWAGSKPTMTLTGARGLQSSRASIWKQPAFASGYGVAAAAAAVDGLRFNDGEALAAAWLHPQNALILRYTAQAVSSVAAGEKTTRRALAEADERVRRLLDA